MSTYTPTADPDVVNKETIDSSQVNLAEYVQRYLEIRSEYLALPQLKSEPDRETLEFYNMDIGTRRLFAINELKSKAQLLYDELKPIKDAGLLPAKYDTGFAQLKEFVNGE